MKRLVYLLLIPVLLQTAGCRYLTAPPEEEVIAVAFDTYLYRSELEDVISPGLSPADSLEIASQYIDNWIFQQVLLNHAAKNLPRERRDFEKQLENYRNSLIIYEYESELIRQKLDTAVTEEQIKSFYNENSADFQLRENIVRISYVKIPLKSAQTPAAKKVRKLLLSDNPDDTEKLIELCDKSLFVCKPADEQWLSFAELLKEFPLDVFDQEGFLAGHTSFETGDSLFTWFVRINEYKFRDSTSPLSLEQQNIRNIILNRRKQELINRMQHEIFQEALKNKDFEKF